MANFEANDQLRMDELTDRMYVHHGLHGYGIYMDKWHCIRKSMYETYLDGTLVAIQNIKFTDFYPTGRFECGMCTNMHRIDHTKHAFFDYNNQFMVCNECNNAVKHRMVPAFPRMCCRVFGEFEYDTNNTVCFFDMVKTGHKANVQKKIAVKRAHRIASSLGFTCLDGQSVADVRAFLLAKRVVAQLRKNIKIKLREKLAYVIEQVTGVNLDTADGISKQITL
jgi:hypothetical protein